MDLYSHRMILKVCGGSGLALQTLLDFFPSPSMTDLFQP